MQKTQENGEIGFGSPVAMPGAFSIALDSNGEPESFYADGIEYYIIANNMGYDGDLELALIPESFRTDVLKEEADSNEVLVENAHSETAAFALLFEFDGDIIIVPACQNGPYRLYCRGFQEKYIDACRRGAVCCGEDRMKRDRLKDKKRIVVKIGSSSLSHEGTGETDLIKLEKLVRELCDYRNRGIQVVLVSSGAIAVGSRTLGLRERPADISLKQACASVGQAKLMVMYQKLFSEYNHVASQILMTKNTMLNPINRENAQNTFEKLLELGVIPIVNENDTISTYELEKLQQFGDNDTLSAIVTAMIRADLLILLSDIDGLFTDDPRRNPEARFIDTVEELTEEMMGLGKGTVTEVGTGGMATKLVSAKIATAAGADMIIANGRDVGILHELLDGARKGTLFVAKPNADFDLGAFLEM